MTATKTEPPRRRPVRWLLRQLEHCLALIGFGAIVYGACFDLSRVTSGSMAPTLCGEDFHGGDLVLTERVSCWFRHPRRWEVVTFQSDQWGQVAKRVVGLPGERIRMLRDGTILIDGQRVEPPPELDFLKYFRYGNLINSKAVECGDGFYVLGDDSRDSDDSRFNGPVQPDNLVGRAWLILAPEGRRGFVNP